MKKILTNRKRMRYVSLFLLLSAFVVFFFIRPEGNAEYACISVLSANIILQLYPLPSQSHRISLMWAVVHLTSVIVLTVLNVEFEIILLSMCGFLIGYIGFRCFQRFHRARSLFCSNNILVFVREFAHLFYCGLLFLTVVCILGLWRFLGAWVILLPLILFSAQYYRAYSTRTLLVSATKERQIYEISRGEIRTVASSVAVNANDAKMEMIYAKAVDLMENQKAFLDSEYSIYDLAEQTGTNKSYISRVINIYSGNNFCKFLNWYRIRYAASYANDNPDVRVTELALKSGFNSNVSFNSAFRMFMGCSPGEYLMQISSQL